MTADRMTREQLPAHAAWINALAAALADTTTTSTNDTEEQ